MVFKDHFSGIADAYAAARPEYPDELFDLIAANVSRDAKVWEPGCGSGQATRGLAARFAHVYATEPSAQCWARRGTDNVTVAMEPGERTALPDASVQLVAVAQALIAQPSSPSASACSHPAAYWLRGDTRISSRPRAWSMRWRIFAP